MTSDKLTGEQTLNMIKLRLKRLGKKREASYRIIAINDLSRRDGRPLEELGFYNPRTDEVRLDVPGIVRRLQQGAQPTDTVRRILVKANVFEQVSANAASS
jgi:small subunit ribosomal protein S16